MALGALNRGWEVLGIRHGYEGVLVDEPDAVINLDRDAVRGIGHLGGTILGTTNRNDPFNYPVERDGRKVSTDVADRVVERLRTLGIEALVALGGDGSMSLAKRLMDRGMCRVIGVPKTIDNDLRGTNVTFGFATAVETTTEALDRLHSTAQAHRRVMVVEVMGRHAGWIALHAGLSGGANVILIPEIEFDLDRVCDYIVRRFDSHYSPIVVVAEGAQPKGGIPSADGAPTDAFGHARLGGIANWLEGEIEQRTGHEARATVLGHVQRGGTPTAFDRVLATRFGLHAIDAAHEGRWGKMTALRSTDIQLVDLSEATAELKTVPESLYREAEVFFG